MATETIAMIQTLTKYGPTASPASWPYSAVRPMARVYLSAGSPRSQWARMGFFPRTSGELLSQHHWAVLDCGRESELLIFGYTYLCLWWKIVFTNHIKLIYITVKETNMHCYTFLPVANETAESHNGMGNLQSSWIIYLKDCVSSERGLGYLFCS